MSTLRNGNVTSDHRLDRLPSVRTDHLDKYPLTVATMPSSAQPLVIGVNWYSAFDTPRQIRLPGERKTRWIIGDRDLGRVRGGHATCLRPDDVNDSTAWWEYYNQGQEGRCVEFAMLRAMTLLNRKRYDITSRFHYWLAQETDEWEGGSYPGASPHYEGTSVRAGLEVLRAFGAVPARPTAFPPDYDIAQAAREAEGIEAYRWALSWQDVRTVLRVPDSLPGVPLLNSWGKGYPRETLLADAAGERLLREDGEFGVVTDR